MLSPKAQTLLATARTAQETAQTARDGAHGRYPLNDNEVRYRELCARDAQMALEGYIAELEECKDRGDELEAYVSELEETL